MALGLCLSGNQAAEAQVGGRSVPAPSASPDDLSPPVIRTNIEISGGIVTGASRVVGLGGAYTSVAEGFAGFGLNPASLGNRKAAAHQWWAMDGTLGLSFLPLSDTDYENDGHTNDDVARQTVVVAGAMAQIDFAGLGWQTRRRSYTVQSPKDPDNRAAYTFYEHLLGLGFQLEDLGLALGLSGVFESTDMEAYKTGFLGLATEDIAGATLEGALGDRGFCGVELGALYRPQNEPYRLGASLKLVGPQKLSELSGRSQNPDASEVAKARIPGEVHSTSHLRLGASWQFGRPYNPRRTFKRIHETNWFRYYFLDEDVDGPGAVPPEVEITQPKVSVEVSRADDGEPVSELPAPDGQSSSGDVERPAPEPTERANHQSEDRGRYALVALDLVLSPPQFESDLPYVGSEGFVVQRTSERAGERWTLALHAGTEVEPIPGWLKVRLGTYFEPSRFTGQSGRVHLTGGVDVHFPHLWLLEAFGAPESPRWARAVDFLREVPFTARIYADGAKNYLSVGLSIGVWN